MNNKTEISIMGKSHQNIYNQEPPFKLKCFSLVILRIFIKFRQCNNSFLFQELIIFDVMTKQLG